MRQAEVLIAVAILLGCARPAPPAPMVNDARPAARSSPEAFAPPGEPVFVKIAAFDCAKLEVFPGEAPARGLISAQGGIRSWHGGGPNGVNWNVQDLRCTVRATMSCTQGKAMLTLRVGQRTVAERVATIANGTADFEVVVSEGKWEPGYDSPSRAPSLKLPFKTAVFRAQVLLECETPVEIKPHSWRFTSVAANDAFVAGFASGE